MRAQRAVCCLVLALGSPFASPCAEISPVESWIPARWSGGPVELARRTKDNAMPPASAAKEAIERWYEPATLDLLDGTPINCLLVTWSAGAAPEVERRQQQLVKTYARHAHHRGIAVLGSVYPGSDPSLFVDAAADAGLEGLVLEGEWFPGGEAFVRQVETSLRAKNAKAVVIPLSSQAAPLRLANWPIFAVEGSWPRSREITDMGTRATPSSEPWLDSNIWLVRSFGWAPSRRPVWVGEIPPGAVDANTYVRAVADGAIAAGHWIVALDDGLRAGLFGRQTVAADVWRRIGASLKFYREHSEWRELGPAGVLAIVMDKSGKDREFSDEYLNLVARRQIPYRLLDRATLSPASLSGVQAVLATDLAPPSDAERKTLRAFAENGGLVVAGKSWGGEIVVGQRYVELIVGKGRIVVYKDDLPDPESVSKDLLYLMGEDSLGLRLFNVPSVLTFAASSGGKLLVHMLNYASRPSDSITLRTAGGFKSARLYAPEAGVVDLAIKKSGDSIEIVIPKLVVCGAVLLEK